MCKSKGTTNSNSIKKLFFFSLFFFWDSNDSKTQIKAGFGSCGRWVGFLVAAVVDAAVEFTQLFISFCFVFPEIKTVSIPLFLLSKLNHTLSESSFMLCPTPKASDPHFPSDFSISESNVALGLGSFYGSRLFQ